MRPAILAFLLLSTLGALAQEAEPVLLHGCESLEGVVLVDGARFPQANLEVNTDAAYISQGEGSLHLSAVSPGNATGNSYLSVELSIPPTDMTKQALIFDAWSSEPEKSRALYVRGFDAEGACVLSWASWNSPVGGEKVTVDLFPGRASQGLGWEPDVVKGASRAAVTRLRFFTGTHDPDTPFDLYLDNIRTQYRDVRSFMEITEPKRLYPDTTIVQDGEPQAIVIVPAGEQWAAVGAGIAAAVKTATGADLPVRSAEALDDETLAAQSAIIVGSIANNRRLLYPYSHHLCFADGVYPGDGGYELRTINDPWGNGNNLVCIGASDVAGATAALEALRTHIAPGDTLVLPSLLETKLAGRAAETWGGLMSTQLDERWAEGQRERAETHLQTAGTRGLFAMAEGIGRNYALTGDEAYARMYVWMIQRTYESYLSNPTTYGGPWGMDSDFHIYQNICAWDVVEECPAISAEERLAVTKILFRWVSEVAPRKVASESSRAVRFNHQTFPALGCLYAGQYFSRYYRAVEAEDWIKLADGTFVFQLDSSKPHCDCNGYQWLTLQHVVRYCLARPNLTYFENGNLRLNGDYAILTMNNQGHPVSYGDIGGWTSLGSNLPILLPAAWYYADGRYEWAAAKTRSAGARLSMGLFDPGEAKTAEPTDLLGTVAWPLDDMWYDTFGGEKTVAREQAFDKVCFRDTFAPEGRYLLLDGLSAGGHGHLDGNAILQWYENGRIWLADGDYIKSLPKYHNGVLILRDGQSETIPAFCELGHVADMDGLGSSCTLLRNYAGADWSRNIIWLKERLFIVADQMTAREDGDFSFRGIWQTVGDTRLDGNRLHIEQDGQSAAFATTADAHCILNEDPHTGKNWGSYPYAGEPVVKSLQGIVDAELKAGEQTTLFMALHASGEQASEVQVRRLSPNSAVIAGVGEPVVVVVGDGDGRVALPGLGSAQADLVALSGTTLWAVGVTEAELAGQTSSFPGGADVRLELSTGAATIRTPTLRSARAEQAETQAHLDVSLSPQEVRQLVLDPLLGPPTYVTAAGTDALAAPNMSKLWSYMEKPEGYLLTNNALVPEAADVLAQATCSPEPLEANVFSGAEGANRLGNAFDGQEMNTNNGVMWDDGQEVTIDLKLKQPCEVRRLLLKAWFATSSSKNKLFQLGRVRLLASNDGFAADSRTLLDATDTEEHGNWGAPGHRPETYAFEGLQGSATDLRLILTPRPGTGVYLAELQVWGDGEGLDGLVAKAEGPAPYVFSALHYADIDGDGIDEVFGGNTNGKLYCLGADGALRWSADCAAQVNCVSTVDFDGDGRPAVVVGTLNAQAIAFDATGERLWTYDVPLYKRAGHVRTVFPADLEGEGRQVLIAGADNWRYHAIDSEGKLIWHYESVHGSTAGCAADIDGDGKDEVLAGTEYYTWHCINPDGSRRWAWRTAAGPCANAVAAGDINGDGDLEVVFGGADTLVQVADTDGKRMWTFNTGDELSAVACADVNGDGKEEVLAASLSFNVYCLDGEGNMLWRTALPNQVRCMAVLEGAEGYRVAAGCDDGGVYVLTAADGAVVSKYATAGRVIAIAAGRPAADATWPEVRAGSEDGNLYGLR